jgi:hypothetical protein
MTQLLQEHTRLPKCYEHGHSAYSMAWITISVGSSLGTLSCRPKPDEQDLRYCLGVINFQLVAIHAQSLECNSVIVIM